MKNDQIIENAVFTTLSTGTRHDLVAALYSPEHIQELAQHITAEGDTSPAEIAEGILVARNFHTFSEWKKAGYSVKKGQHATLICNLWRYTDKPSKAAAAAATEAGADVPEVDPHFYLVKSYLFHRLQVEPIEPTKK